MTDYVSIYPSLLHVSDGFQGILLDAFGVFWGGNDIGPILGAKETMQQLVEQGKIVGILSNSSLLVAKEVDKFARHGFIQGIHFHFMITSGEVSRNLALHNILPFHCPNRRFWVFGGGHPRGAPHKDIFHETGYIETPHPEEADFIFIGIPHVKGEDQIDTIPFQKLICELEHKHLPMLCTNPDHFVQEGNPPKIVIRQGSIAALYEAQGGVVHYIGKPYDKVYTYAFEQFQKAGVQEKAEILMCGDMR